MRTKQQLFIIPPGSFQCKLTQNKSGLNLKHDKYKPIMFPLLF